MKKLPNSYLKIIRTEEWKTKVILHHMEHKREFSTMFHGENFSLSNCITGFCLGLGKISANPNLIKIIDKGNEYIDGRVKVPSIYIASELDYTFLA